MKCFVIALLFILCGNVGNSQIISTIAGTGVAGYNADGIPATNSKLSQPGELAFDSNGHLYINDGFNHRIRMVDDMGIIHTIAGTGVSGYNGDNIPATNAKINNVVSILFDKRGNLVFDDGANNRIRQIDMSTGIITTIAGNGGVGFVGDGDFATNASFHNPGHLAYDAIGNLYIMDVTNYRIRKVDTFNIITTVVGNGIAGFLGDGGPATDAEINIAEGLICDTFGNLYFADRANSRIRKLDITSNTINTIAGNGVLAYSGDGTAATACGMWPQAVIFDKYFNLCYVDPHNDKVVRINSSGTVTTLAGNGIGGFSVDGIAATASELYQPWDIKFDICGNLLIGDLQNQRVRKVTYPPILTTPTISISGTTGAMPGASVTITATIANAGSSYTVEWMNHGTVFSTTSIPSVIYTKGAGIDTITAKVVPTSYGCWDSTTSTGHIVYDGSLAIPCNTKANNLQIYPNPAHTTLTITGNTSATTISISNMLGIDVAKCTLVNGNAELYIANLPTGIYAVKADGVNVQRLVKE